ncbi:MAG: F0F1 ATP synthase subunit B [Candidatus Spechtbacterales bacterium]
MEIIESLHIEWSQILAQAVNFILLLGILTWFVYKPLLRALNERRERIETSLEQAAEIDQRMDEMRAYHQEQMAKAHKEAQEIIAAARVQTDEERQEQLDRVQHEVEQLIERAHQEIGREKDAMLRQARGELAQLLVPALERVLQSSMDETTQQAVMARAIQTIKSEYSKERSA